MKWHHKVTIAAGAFLLGMIPASFIVREKIKESIQPYVESHLEQIVKSQEEKLGIQHFGIPEVKYGLPPEVQVSNDFAVAIGIYRSKDDRIYLSLGSSITSELNLVNVLATIITLGNIPNVKETLDHELGHYYVDKLNESLGRGDWPGYSYGLFEGVGIKLVAEGIAEYFKKTINGGEDDFEDSDWPDNFFDFFSVPVLYEGGYHLVKPIIDRYGKRGIEYLIQNPPKAGDLDRLPEYQDRVIKFLAKEK